MFSGNDVANLLKHVAALIRVVACSCDQGIAWVEVTFAPLHSGLENKAFGGSSACS